MAYCTVAQVRAQVVTDLEDATITDIITEIDAWIDWRYSLAGVPALVIQRASRLKTAYQIMLRDPNAQKIGEYSENRAKQMELMKLEPDEALIALASAGGTLEAFNEPIL